MKKLFPLIFIVIAACNTFNVEQAEKDLKFSVGKKTGLDVADVSLIKTGEYTYEGVVKHIDNSTSSIVVNIDQENTGKYIWQIIKPSQTLIDEEIKKIDQKVELRQKEVEREIKENRKKLDRELEESYRKLERELEEENKKLEKELEAK